MKCGSYYETVLIWLWVVLCNSACVKLLWSSWLLILTKILTSIISPALQTNTPHQKLDLIDKYYCLHTLPRLHSHLSSWSFCHMPQPFNILNVVHIAEYLWVTSLEWTIYKTLLYNLFSLLETANNFWSPLYSDGWYYETLSWSTLYSDGCLHSWTDWRLCNHGDLWKWNLF